MFELSPVHILIALAIALLVFGPKRLPEMGRNLGRGIRDFKSGITGEDAAHAAVAPATAHEPIPTAQELMTEAATPKAVAQELDAARTRSSAAAPSA